MLLGGKNGGSAVMIPKIQVYVQGAEVGFQLQSASNVSADITAIDVALRGVIVNNVTNVQVSARVDHVNALFPATDFVGIDVCNTVDVMPGDQGSCYNVHIVRSTVDFDVDAGQTGIRVNGNSSISDNMADVVIDGCTVNNGGTGFLVTNTGNTVFAANAIQNCYATSTTPYDIAAGTEFLETGNRPGAAATGTPSAFIFAPGGPVTASNVYTDWATLYAAVNAAPPGCRRVLIQNEWDPCEVPSGSWRLRGWVFEGVSWNKSNSPILSFLDGAVIDNTADGDVDNNWNRITFKRMRVWFRGNTTWWTLTDVGYEALDFEDCTIRANGSASPLSVPDTFVGTIILRATRTVSMLTPLVETNTSGAIQFYMYDGSSVDTLLSGTGEASYTYDSSVTYGDPFDGGAFTGIFSQTPLLKRKFTIAGAVNAAVPADPLAAEVTVGGFSYDPFDDTDILFEALVDSAAANVVVRLYDIGALGTLAAAVLVSELTIPNGTGAANLGLLPVAVPANPDEIYAAARMYAVRVVADVTDSIYVYSAGIVLRGPQYD